MIVMEWLRWRITQARVRKAATEMLEQSGDRAFFASHEEAWRAQGDGNDRKAKFKRAVCEEIARSIQRREVLRAIISPARNAEPPRARAAGHCSAGHCSAGHCSAGHGSAGRKPGGKPGSMDSKRRVRRTK